MDAEKWSISLGDLNDENLCKAIRNVLKKNGAKLIDQAWAPTGIIDVSMDFYKIEDTDFYIDSDNVIGCQINGPKDLVEGLAEQILEELRQPTLGSENLSFGFLRCLKSYTGWWRRFLI